MAFAKLKLLDYYCRAHAKAPLEHRAGTILDGHACLHEVLLTCWGELEDAELARAVPELLPPPVVTYLPATSRDPDEVLAEEVTGIAIGERQEEG